jgi:lipopolysaccharide transport system permease protein
MKKKTPDFTVISKDYVPSGAARLTGNAFTDSVRVVSANWTVFRAVVRRDLMSRYKGSLLGGAWAVLLPLVMMTVYTTVFSFGLGVRFEGASGLLGSAFATWLGLVVWQAIAEALNRAAAVVHDNAPFVKRMPFPVAVLPLALVGVAAVNTLISLAVFVAATVVIGPSPAFSWFAIPPILLIMTVGLSGLVWIVASAGGVVRDIRHVVPVLMTLGMFATPVVWPLSSMPTAARAYMELNPLAWCFEVLRGCLFGTRIPSLTEYCSAGAVAASLYVLGYATFRASEKGVRDAV